MLERSFFAALLLFALSATVAAQETIVEPGPRTPLTVSGANGSEHAFEVELALTNQQRAQGLMYRTELAPNHGMLFIFHDVRPRSFWMRNTYIPLDIIFVRADGRIVNIVANAEPRTDIQRRSTGPAKAVFEIAGGRAAELGIKPGDIVRHALLGNLSSDKGR